MSAAGSPIVSGEKKKRAASRQLTALFSYFAGSSFNVRTATEPAQRPPSFFTNTPFIGVFVKCLPTSLLNRSAASPSVLHPASISFRPLFGSKVTISPEGAIAILNLNRLLRLMMKSASAFLALAFLSRATEKPKQTSPWPLL